MAKFSLRLQPEEQFETLRDFGFGTPTAAEFPAESRGILALPAPLAADVHPCQHGDGLRVRRDAGPARRRVRRDRERRRAAGAHTGARGARSIGRACSTVIVRSRCGASVSPAIAASCASFCVRRWGKAAPASWRSSRTTRCWARPAPRSGSRMAATSGVSTRRRSPRSFPADHPQLVVIVKIDNPQGQLLRRPHGRAGHANHAAAGAGLAPGGDRPRAAGRRDSTVPCGSTKPLVDASPRQDRRS